MRFQVSRCSTNFKVRIHFTKISSGKGGNYLLNMKFILGWKLNTLTGVGTINLKPQKFTRAKRQIQISVSHKSPMHNTRLSSVRINIHATSFRKRQMSPTTTTIKNIKRVRLRNMIMNIVTHAHKLAKCKRIKHGTTAQNHKSWRSYICKKRSWSVWVFVFACTSNPVRLFMPACTAAAGCVFYAKNGHGLVLNVFAICERRRRRSWDDMDTCQIANETHKHTNTCENYAEKGELYFVLWSRLKSHCP